MKLGIDFGTWYSSAALCDDRGHIDFIEDPFDHRYSIPSSVFFTEDGKFLIGSAAENSRRMDPGRYCRDNIKLMGIGSREPIHLGNQTFSAEELVAKILAWFKQEADKKAIALGYSAFEGVTLTVPALWRDHRRAIMNKAAVLAGFDETQLIILEEPVAAAISFATQSQITEEETILIYDLGGGTFDAALVQRQGANYLTLGMDGLFDCGGVHFNRKIYQWIKGQADDALGILLDRHNKTAEAIRLRSNIGDECNNTKCQLSATQQTQLSVSGNSGQLDCYPLTRSEFTDMIANDLDRTIDCCRRVIKAAGFSTKDISRVLLIGGSCRIPAVKQWVEKALGLEAVLAPQLELSICSGAALYLPDKEKCRVIIIRENRLIGLAVGIVLFVDNIEVFNLGNGEIKSFQILPGKHVFQVRNPFWKLGETTQEIDIPERSNIEVRTFYSFFNLYGLSNIKLEIKVHAGNS